MSRFRLFSAFRFSKIVMLVGVSGMLHCALAAQTMLSIPVWIYLEAVPGSGKTHSSLSDIPPYEDLRDLSSFLFGGMIYGWKFSYVPPDKARNVEEEFSLEPIVALSPEDPSLTLEDVKSSYPRLEGWARYALSEAQAKRLQYWESSGFRTGKGRGSGERKDESGGIRDAYVKALLNSVRERAREMEKNKPKEITGELLLRDNPRLFPDEGLFIAEVRTVIHIENIVPYRLY